MRWLRLGLVGVVLLLGGLAIAPAAGRDAAVSIANRSFQSGSVAPGDTVVWTNNEPADTNTPVHRVQSDPESSEAFGSPELQRGAEYRHTFPSNGTFAFHCAIHPDMKGTIQVLGSPSATAPPAATTTRAPSTTARSGTTTTRKGATTTSTTGTFDTQTSVVETTTSEPTSTTAAPLAIKEASKSGGTSSTAIGAILIAIVAVLGGGAYALYRLRGAGN